MYSCSRLAALFILLLTSACSTVIEGRTQNISVDTFPTGAQCTIKDNDIVLARVQTPGIATIEKSKNDILVECSKDGFITNKKRNRADMAITSLGNMALGKLSFVGDMVDTASGAAHKYDSRVFMALSALPPVARMDATPLQPAIGMASAQAAVQPEQLARELARMLSTQDVVITHQSPEEVIRLLMNGEQVQGTMQESSNTAQQPFAVLAQATIYESHRAE